MTPAPVIGDIPLIDSENRTTSLRDAVASDGPVFVNFIFTSCTTVCPVMSAGFAQLQNALGAERDRVRLVSISIDPDVDTVATLRAYASRYRAGASWRFLTGSRASVEAAQQAFGAYRGDKSNHAPATYFRRGPDGPWDAVNGLSSAEALLGLYRNREGRDPS
jgi:protein SCO1/2